MNNYKLCDFLRILLIEYDNTCEIFYYIYDKVYGDLGLYDFEGKSFIYFI